MHDSDVDNLAPEDRFITHAPCTNPSHAQLAADNATLTALVEVLVLEAPGGTLSSALRRLADRRTAEQLRLDSDLGQLDAQQFARGDVA